MKATALSKSFKVVGSNGWLIQYLAFVDSFTIKEPFVIYLLGSKPIQEIKQ